MKVCERCNLPKETYPENHELCEDCCNEMLGTPSVTKHDWSHVDFETSEVK